MLWEDGWQQEASVLIMSCVDVLIMEHVWRRIHVSVLMVGLDMTVEYRFVTSYVCIMEIVLLPAFALVKEAGKALTALSQFVHKNVKMGVFVLLLTHASACNGQMNIAMVEMVVVVLCFVSLMATHKTLVGQDLIAQFLFVFKMRSFCLWSILIILQPTGRWADMVGTICLSVLKTEKHSRVVLFSMLLSLQMQELVFKQDVVLICSILVVVMLLTTIISSVINVRHSKKKLLKTHISVQQIPCLLLVWVLRCQSLQILSTMIITSDCVVNIIAHVQTMNLNT
mmetsp:Transcript_6008/g.9779  ORF Transcript_6008/g.9779 Transcript_6008/m.9779 type:complete len:283 (+) Transcript_6008:3719-4567(+)